MSASAPRRTQEQRSSETRDRILDAAVACLVEEGLAGTHTLAVQKRAGVSRGRLLHHFPTREALVLAAAGRVYAVRLAETEHRLAERAAGWGPGDAERLDAVVALMWESFHEPHFWAAAELWVAARTNPVLRAALLPHERRTGEEIKRLTAVMFGGLSTHPRYPFVLDQLLSSMRGVALTYAFDRKDPGRDPHLARWRELARILTD